MFQLHLYKLFNFISYLQVYLHLKKAKENFWKYSSFKITFSE